MSGTPASGPDSRRGWIVAVVGAVAMVFTFGTPLSYGIFRDPMSAAFGISPVALSVVFGVMLFTFFIGSGLVGVFGVRFPARAVLLVAAGATGAVAPALYVVHSLGGLLVVFGVLGLAVGTMFVLVASVVPRWFEVRRGTATGLIFVGNGLGLFVLPPVWQYAFGAFGVRRGFLYIVGVSALTFLVTGLVCRRPHWAERSTASLGDIQRWLRTLFGTRSFKLLFVGIALAFAWYQLLAAYAVDLFAARGLGAGAASVAFGLIGGVSVVSRIGGGYLADRFGSRRSFLASLSCTAAGVALMFVGGLPVLVLAVLLMGLGLGGVATLYIPLLMEIYASEMDTAVVGLFNVAAGLAALIAPTAGTIALAYTEGFAVVIAMTFGAVVLSGLSVARGTA